MSGIQDAIGDRGQYIFGSLITKFHSESGPLFKCQFLGDKWPRVDFIVELLNVDGTTPYFFVQVKTSRLGYTIREHRLRISYMTKEKVLELAAYPAPTYIVGVDEIKETGYIVSANGEYADDISSISTKFPLNKANRMNLWKEVRDFWAAYPQVKLNSRFLDPEWS